MTKYKVLSRPIGGTVELDQIYGVGAVFEADSSDDLDALVEMGVIEETDEEVPDADEPEEPEPEAEPESEPKSKPKAKASSSKR